MLYSRVALLSIRYSEPSTWRHHVSDGIFLRNKQNKMAGVSNAKTPVDFAMKDNLSMFNDEADSVNTNSKHSMAMMLTKVLASSAGVQCTSTLK